MSSIDRKARELTEQIQQELENMLRDYLGRVESESKAIREEFYRKVEDVLSKLKRL